MKKIMVLLITILALFTIFNKYEAKEDIIPEEAIRFRVIANSNSIYDQNIKLQLKNEIQNQILLLLKDTDNIEDSRKIIRENLNYINNTVDKKLKELGYKKKFTINYGYNKFPKKEYKGISYKEGLYESLVITLGEGQGDNWWCVLFPPLCLLEADETNVEDAEYTFMVKEIINKFINK